MKENINHKIARFNETINSEISPDLSAWQRFGIFCDFVGEYLFHGAYLNDYCQYDFYYKNRRERDNYIVFDKWMQIKNVCNDPDKVAIMDDKFLFNEAYKKFLGRDYLDINTATLEDFVQFLEGKEAIFVKEYDGTCGIGVDKVYIKDIDDISALFDEYKAKKMLCEGVLTQCKEMAEFNESSINTLRVVTIRKADGKVKVMGGLLRTGRKGRIADNFHHNGIVAFLDGDTGVVSTTGVNKDKDRFILHPDSGKQIVGFNVPVWDKVVDAVTKAALVTPELRYTGWDVVIDENYDIAIIEGNSAAEPDGEQVTTKTGRWPLYKKYLDEIEKLQN